MDLHALISEMLEKDPLKRPPTALVVGNRLKAIQQGMARLEAERNRNQSASDQPLTDRNIAKELTSIDLNDDQDEELKATNHMATQDQPTAIASDSLIERLGREDAAATKPRHADAETDLSVEIHKTAHRKAWLCHQRKRLSSQHLALHANHGRRYTQVHHRALSFTQREACPADSISLHCCDGGTAAGSPGCGLVYVLATDCRRAAQRDYGGGRIR